MRGRGIVIVGLLVTGALGPWCATQEKPAAQEKPAEQPAVTPTKRDPKSDPGLSDPSLEDEILGHRRAGEPPPAIAPTPPKPAQKAPPSVPPVDAPGLTEQDTDLPARRFYAEGAFMPPRPGTLLRARTGELIFLPRVEDESKPEPAMVLMDCQKLGQLDAAASAPGFSGAVVLSGQVFVYRDVHYLLPTVFSVQGAEEKPSAPADPVKAGPDPRAEDVIKQLESRRGGPRVMDRPTARAQEPQPAANDAAKDARLLQEGTVLVMRRGRLMRQPGSDGRYAFAFDNDPNSPAPGPMTILPCAELQQLEALVGARGDDLVFKMSGRVTQYQGRDYLLPVMHQVVTAGEIVPMQ